MLNALYELIPSSVRSLSGSVFYSGRSAFAAPATPIYLLGLNPGGSPEEQSQETVERHAKQVIHTKPDNWSEYRDESWKGRPPGTLGMQPRVCHLLQRLGLDPGLIPASNLVFARSPRESKFEGDLLEFAAETWPFHQQVIDTLGVRVVLCFGHTAGDWVASQLRAHRVVDQFVENNRRQWASVAMASGEGLIVVRASHPSIAKWQTPATDPTPLVRRVLETV